MADGDLTFGRIGFTSTTVFSDTFERSDRGLNGDNGWTSIGASGTPVVFDPNREMEIVSGRASFTQSGASYAWRSVPGLREVEVSFRFAAGSTGNAGLFVLTSKLPVSTPSPIDIGYYSIHTNVVPAGRSLSLYSGAIESPTDTDLFTLSADTDYTFRMVWDGADTITVTDPDGGTESITNSRISELWGDTLFIEMLNPSATLATDKLASFNRVVAYGKSTGLDLKCTSWAQEGDTARVEGVVRFQPTVDDLIAIRDALQGYGPDNTDEPVIPVTYANDPSRNGFYRVLRCEVTSEITGRPITTATGPELAYRFDAELQRLPGWKAPVLEVVRSGALRSNVHSVVTADDRAVTGLPGSLKVPRWSNTPDGEENVSTSDGSVRVFGDATTDVSVTYSVDPGSFYEGAATIEVSSDEGQTWRPVCGRQVDNLPGHVRLSNGRVRVTCSLTDGATLLLTEVWDATGDAPGWESCEFNVTDSGSSTTISTYSSSGTATISSPAGIASGSDGNLWFASNGNNRIIKATTGGVLTAYAPATVDGPTGICSGPDGLLWFTSTQNDRIGKITTSGTATTYTDSNISSPQQICSGPDSLLWFTSLVNDRIGKITTTGTVTTYTDANIDGPRGICSGPDGLLWFTSTFNDRIGKITTSGTVTTYSTGVGNLPWQICSGPDGLLWYTRLSDDAICKITTTGTVTTYTSGVPNGPNHICSDGTDLWFTYADGIGKITTTGTVTTYTNANVDDPAGIVEGNDSNLWFTSVGNNRVGVLNPSTSVSGPVEFGGSLTVLRNSPESVSVRLGAADGPEMLDLTLRRGLNFIEGYVQSSTSSTYGIFRTASETGASVTGGIEASAANDAGNKFTLLSPRTITKDTTGVSGISLTAGATTFPFAMSPVNTDTVSGTATLAAAYFSAVNERQHVSVR